MTTLAPAGPDTPPEPARTPRRGGDRAARLAGWLDEARGALSGGDVDTSLDRYQSLIKKRAHLDEVIADLNQALQYEHPIDIHVWTTLGDAYAKKGSLQQALDALTKAEELLR